MFISNEVDRFDNYFSYFYYNGSLSSPQCDEHVRWIVVAEPIPLGMTVYQMFNDAHARGNQNYKGNHRYVQPLYDRKVLYFDSEMVKCGNPTTHKDELDDGHFEKYKA